MRIACWILQATNGICTAFLPQKLWYPVRINIPFYVHCLSWYNRDGVFTARCGLKLQVWFMLIIFFRRLLLVTRRADTERYRWETSPGLPPRAANPIRITRLSRYTPCGSGENCVSAKILRSAVNRVLPPLVQSHGSASFHVSSS